jgi:hypothetical protein
MGRHWSSAVRRSLKLCALSFIAVPSVLAQSPALDTDKRAATTACGSVVIIKCDAPAASTVAGSSAQVQQSRSVDLRRQNPLTQQLEGVVIEGELIRRRSIEETMASAFPAVRARDGNYTVETGEGTKCSCMNVCPPWPLPCCTCSGHLSRYRAMPGSSPLN